MARNHEGGRLPKVVKQFGIVSFLNDMASEMVYPLLPALITARLGGGAIALGALDGISDAVAAGVKLVSGRLADRRRLRRPLIVAGYAVAALVRPLMGWASAAWQVIALRAADRLGKGARNPPRDAVIADASSPSIRGRAFGFHRSMDHAGAVVGPLLAWILLSVSNSTPAQVIIASAIPGVLAVAIVAWALRRVDGAGERRDADALEASAGPRSVDGGPHRRPLFLLIVLFAFARFPETLLLLRLQSVGVAVALIPLVWAVLHVLRSAGAYPGGWLSDRIGVAWTMVLGWVAYVAVAAGLATTESAATATVVFLCFALVTSLTEAPERAFVAAIAGVKSGTRFGVYHASVGIAGLFGGLAFGLLYARVGGEFSLGASAALALVAAVIGASGAAAGSFRA
jgi:MFS family permease